MSESPDAAPPAPVVVRVERDGFVESEHRGHVAVVDRAGVLLGHVGDARLTVYPRSALKPFQAAGVVDALGGWRPPFDDAALAIACASHTAADEHVIEAARLLALAGLDEDALACPPALPVDAAALAAAGRPERIAFNCSGKHAAFLLGQTALGAEPAAYLDPESAIQRLVRDRIAAVCGPMAGRGVDGCGAPAWRITLDALARGFARLADPDDPDPVLRRVAAAMRARPLLVGGVDCDDSALMAATSSVVAKRGAEAVFAAGAVVTGGRVAGIAVKIADGGSRAAGPVVAAVLERLGLRVPDRVRAPVVLGGEEPHGRLVVADAVTAPR